MPPDTSALARPHYGRLADYFIYIERRNARKDGEPFRALVWRGRPPLARAWLPVPDKIDKDGRVATTIPCFY